MRVAHRKNAAGDFYVQNECCTLCGVPWRFAPTSFDYDDTGCWVSRQPATPDDEAKMLEVFATQDLDCIRYRGTEARIIELLVDMGEGERCDGIEASIMAKRVAASEEARAEPDRTLALGLWSRVISWLTSRRD